MKRRDLLIGLSSLLPAALLPSIAGAAPLDGWPKGSLRVQNLKLDRTGPSLHLSCNWDVPGLINHRYDEWCLHMTRRRDPLTSELEFLQLFETSVSHSAFSELAYVDTFGDCRGSGIHGGCRHEDRIDWRPRRSLDGGTEWRAYLEGHNNIRSLSIAEWIEGQRLYPQDPHAWRERTPEWQAYMEWRRQHSGSAQFPRNGSTLLIHDAKDQPFKGQVLYLEHELLRPVNTEIYPPLPKNESITDHQLPWWRSRAEPHLPETWSPFNREMKPTLTHDQDPGAFHAATGATGFRWRLNDGRESYDISSMRGIVVDKPYALGPYTVRVVDHILA